MPDAAPTPAPPPPPRTALLLGLQAAALLAVGVPTLYRVMLGGGQQDVRHYREVADALLRGGVPYRDFMLEYPPLALAALALPRLAAFWTPAFSAYLWALMIQAVALSTGIGLLVARMTARWSFPMPPARALATYVALVVVGANLLPWRYDVFPALLTAGALHALLAERPLASGIWLGLGIAAKVYPGALVPVFACVLLARARTRALARFLAGCAGAVLACLLPFLAAGPGILLAPVRYHASRGFEIESVVAGLAMLVRAAGLRPLGVAYDHGAYHLDAAWLEPLRAASPLIAAGAFALFALLCLRATRRESAETGAVSPATVARLSAAAVLLFVCASKVFSPQYVFWLLPFAPLLRPRDAALVVLTFALTMLLFPLSFRALVAMEPAAVALLNLRNLAALAALASLTAGPPARDDAAFFSL